MLRLSQCVNQSFIIQTSDGQIEVCICKIDGGQVGVGITAPKHVNIVRKELLKKRVTEEAKPFELY